MKTVKFGGSSLATAGQIRRVGDILAADGDRRLVVVSAPGRRAAEDTKVTDLLIAAAEARLTHRSGEAALTEAVNRFADLASGLGLPASCMRGIERDMRQRLMSSTADEGLYLDSMKAAGECNCARLVAEYLRGRGLEAHFIDPREAGLILSAEAGNARVLRQSYGNLRSLRDRSGITVFPGFYGYTESGRLVTFPRGGSDITGAILAAAVGADLYENFTDVDSVFAASPRLVPDPRPVGEITYREMRELSYAGFSVFHDEALEPVFHGGIPVAVKNTNNPDAGGTRIVPNRVVEGAPVAGIAATGGFCTVYVSRYLMNREVGFGRRLLEVFEDEAIPYEHTPSGIDNLSVIVREEFFDHVTEERVLRRVRTELDADEVSVERGLALVMVVGEGMRHTVGLAARTTRAFARGGINLEMINQGSSEVSMMFGVKEADMQEAVRSLYAEFFPD